MMKAKDSPCTGVCDSLGACRNESGWRLGFPLEPCVDRELEETEGGRDVCWGRWN